MAFSATFRVCGESLGFKVEGSELRGQGLKEVYWEPQTENPKNIVGIWNIPTRVLIFYYISTIFLGLSV